MWGFCFHLGSISQQSLNSVVLAFAFNTKQVTPFRLLTYCFISVHPQVTHGTTTHKLIIFYVPEVMYTADGLLCNYEQIFIIFWFFYLVTPASQIFHLSCKILSILLDGLYDHFGHFKCSICYLLLQISSIWWNTEVIMNGECKFKMRKSTGDAPIWITDVNFYFFNMSVWNWLRPIKYNC